MIAFWTALNFVLILLAFYLIVLLYQKIRLLHERDPRKFADDLQRAFDTHLKEMREENDRLIRELAHYQQTETDGRAHEVDPTDSGTLKSDSSADAAVVENSKAFRQVLSQSLDANTDGGAPGPVDSPAEPGKPQEEWTPPVEGIKDKWEQSVYIRALKLKQEGKTNAEIAKRLNRGEAEVELLLKFRENRHT
ncbi:hypothetical protein ABNN70_10195 [Sporolactobacillus sp. Y61]|jgi:hypothetical protein|uniref:Swarming motility protein SwrB n=1 Tax=Sporolactobacillus sp. Y61 TaxID=3160863 RepID=A0AAU8IDI4_9BACL|nr:hypothetical protein [Sporolactobacillus sp. THM19-2]RYL92973.1 hypothetical protein EWH91_06690 [Sporolactobacillus sp. THM19-2]